MLVVNFLNRFTLAFWRFNLSKFLWYLAGRNIAVCEQMLECSGALQGEAQCFWFLCTLKIGVLFFVSMPGSWLWEAPGLSFTSIVSWLENLINKSWLLDMFVRKNQSQKKTNEILRVSRSTAITVTMVFFGHEVCQAKADLEENLLNGSLQRRGWAMALKVWQLSVFFLILFDFVCPSCKHSGPCRFRVPFNADFCT